MTLALDAVVSLDTPDYDLDGGGFVPPPPVPTGLAGHRRVVQANRIAPRKRPRKVETVLPIDEIEPTLEVFVAVPTEWRDDEEALILLGVLDVRAFDDDEAILLLL